MSSISVVSIIFFIFIDHLYYYYINITLTKEYEQDLIHVWARKARFGYIQDVLLLKLQVTADPTSVKNSYPCVWCIKLNHAQKYVHTLITKIRSVWGWSEAQGINIMKFYMGPFLESDGTWNGILWVQIWMIF